jgi:exodeoxyribonuclease VII large subunit
MPIYTVSQISEAIKKTLEGSFPSLQIRGEISNLKLQSSGHYYFTLKDASAQLSCALFRLDAACLKRPIKDGDQIVALGNLSVFTPKGSYQLIVKQIQHQGLGDLLVQLEALKNGYKAKGYFDPARKKPIPKFPQTIGVITSPTGAVIQDIIQTLTRRHPGFKLLLMPTKVQGEGAALEIASSIDLINHYKLCDLIICGRGGGSLEDLWCFNEPAVVEAIYRSTIPIISAVGHETDFTLADFVADLRAPTPTAAAELALGSLTELIGQIKSCFQTIKQLFEKKLSHDQQLLEQLKKRPQMSSPALLFQGFYFCLDRLEAKLASMIEQMLLKYDQILQQKKAHLIHLKPDRQLSEKKSALTALKQKLYHQGQSLSTSSLYQLETLHGALKQTIQTQLKERSRLLEQLQALLQNSHPDHILLKGYAILQSSDGHLTYTKLSDIKELSVVRIQLHDGYLSAHINQKHPTYQR